jgi:murein DD-endopeptidase MepM/ murein hydrolase activator NlpD
MPVNYLLVLILILSASFKSDLCLPVRTPNRKSLSTLSLTRIGEFGLLRKSRPTVPAHYHTGIDIRRPANNYPDEPIFPICDGIVISKRQDGPYAQLIIEHNNPPCWSVYEHVAGIKVNLNDHVNPDSPIARFMNKTELNKYGWQFDHFHLEILRIRPVKLAADPKNPERKFSSYTLVCYTKDDLDRYYFNPIEFFRDQLRP